MQAERWQQVEKLFHSVLEMEPEGRAAFLQQACQGDQALRLEVERLMANDSQAQLFMESRALNLAARALAKNQPRGIDLTGCTVLHYRITEKIGAGGMGEVYRAEDTNIHRNVALKVLPEEFSGDAERLARFQREAELLSSFNHPNIATLYGLEESDGKRFIVMELVEGKTLAHRLLKGPLRIDEALQVCGQIAEGLEAAHEKGVIHRDLKPANLIITVDEKVKILDFGLAKALPADLAATAGTNSPTITEAMTRVGTILGTATYMSPEQANGKRVDRRTDIWSFGCILYECMTGRAPFKGETVTDTVAKILEGTPDWNLLPSNTPLKIKELLRRCLQRNPNERLQHIGDARIEIGDAFSEPQGIPDTRKFPLRWVLWTGAATLLIGILIGLGLMRQYKPLASPSLQPVVRTTIKVEPGHWLDGNRFSTFGFGQPTRTAMAISSDGRFIVYSAIKENPGAQDRPRLYLRRLDEMEAKPISGTEGGISPFLSPDDRWIGFWAGGKLKRVSADGGIATELSDVPMPFGFHWGRDNRIVFALPSGLVRMSAEGGVPEVLTVPDKTKMGHRHRLPHSLPNGKGILFTSIRHSWDWQPRVAVLDPGTRNWRFILEDAADARFVETGHLAFLRQGKLMLVPFDVDRLEITGKPFPVIDGVIQALNIANSRMNTAAGQFSFSASGSLVFVPGGMNPDPENSLVWADHKGIAEPIASFKAPFFGPRLSPDGQQIAYYSVGRQRQVYIYDLNRGTTTKLNSEGLASRPIWTPDGRRLIFCWTETETANLYWQDVNGSSPMERLSTSDWYQSPVSCSPDGEILAFLDDPYIMLLRLPDRSVTPFMNSRFRGRYPEISPDGRRIAYVSDQLGRAEVYVQSFPVPGGRSQISNEGGTEPLWSRDGRQLYYRRLNQVWVVDVNTGSAFSASRPRLVFENSVYVTGAPIRCWDISLDGQRFLMVKAEERKPQPITEMILVHNWFEELKRLDPTGKK